MLDRSGARGGVKLTVLFVLVAAGVLAFLLKPEDRGLATANAALTPLNGTARAHCEGTPCAFIDLDALDANIDFVKREVGARKLRVVAKSLPSLELLSHVMERAQTRRLMVFHAPHAETLLANFKDADLLFGKPMPEEAIEALVKHVGDDAARVRFLVDSRERLAGLVRVARAHKRTLRVVIELDVGLRRGGVVHDNELVVLMDSLAQSPELTFAGVMGYDGHVSHAPAVFGPGQERASARAWRSAMADYKHFLALMKKSHPEWFTGPAAKDVVLDGGGSHTVVRYAGRSPDEAPPDELAVGSAFLKPTLFDDALLEPARPAVFLAMPILKRVTTPSIPFLEGAWPLLVKYDPNLAVGFYLYGGPWDGEIVWPPGLRNAPFHEEKIHNLLPNQELLSGSVHVPATEGDYVFVRPQEGDGIAVFTRILAVRDGKVEKAWAPMPTLN